MITAAQAGYALATKEKVFTADGDAVVIDKLGREDLHVRVNGPNNYLKWRPLTEIWLSPDSDAPGKLDPLPFDRRRKSAGGGS